MVFEVGLPSGTWVLRLDCWVSLPLHGSRHTLPRRGHTDWHPPPRLPAQVEAMLGIKRKGSESMPPPPPKAARQ